MSNHQKQQDMLNALRDLAIELGCTPTRDMFISRSGFGRKMIDSMFGGYTIMVHNLGLDPVSRSKVTNAIFEAPIAQVIEEHVPREAIAQPQWQPTLFIGDTHFPFVCNRTLDFIYKFAEKNKPKRIIQVGDLYDMYAHSKFPKSLNVYTPDQEEDLGRAGAEAMWKTLRGIAPSAQCVQLFGNHDVRPVKRTIESAPTVERAVKKYMTGLMSFDGVTLIEDPRQEFIFDNVLVIHGHTRFGAHRDFNMMNVVCGHSHKGGVLFRRFRGQTFWELNAGFAGDAESKALGYTPQKIHDCTAGLGWLDEYGPRFIPA